MNHNRWQRAFTILELLVSIVIISLLIGLALPAIQAARESARRMQCSANLAQIGLALHNYESTHRVFPFGVGAVLGNPGEQPITSEESRRFSAQSQMLPFLEMGNVYDQIDFGVQPFFPDTTGDPRTITGVGPNETAAQAVIPVFLCPSDIDRLKHPWGHNNYRACTGNTWDGSKGNGMFGLGSAVRPGDISDGLSNTAAFCERILGDDDDTSTDMSSDLFGLSAPWTEDSFKLWCKDLTESAASSLHNTDSNGGMNWLEGNMNWTRYNHLLPPGTNACKADLTWNGVNMPANSRHGSIVQTLLADGSVKTISYEIDAAVWSGLGSIAEGEVITSF